MDRVLTHERVCQLDRLFPLLGFVIRVHEFQLDLPAQVTERIAGLDCLEDLDAAAVILALDRVFRQLVGLGKVVDSRFLLVIARAAGCHSGKRQQGRQPQQLAGATDQTVGDFLHFHCAVMFQLPPFVAG